MTTNDVDDVDPRLREILFKLVARRIGSGDARSLAHKVILMTGEINRRYGLQVGEAMFFTDDAGTFLFQFRDITVGVFNGDGVLVEDRRTFIGDLEDIVRLLQELADGEE